MAGQYIITYDLGTSSNKACLFSRDGRLVASSHRTYPVFYGTGGEAEQRPQDWWDSVRDTTRDTLQKAGVSPDEVEAVSFSAQVGALVLLDQNDAPLQNRAAIWMDTRGRAQAERIRKEYGLWRHYSCTGGCVDIVIMQISKLMWLQENRPELLEKTKKVIGAKEYIILRLCGKAGFSDESHVGGSGLYNVFERRYDDSILQFTSIPPEILPEPLPPQTVIGTIRPEAAEEIGLTPRTKVVLGLADGASSYLGAGGLQEDALIVNLGTASWLGLTVKGPPVMQQQYQVGIERLDSERYRLDLHSHAGGAVTNWAVEHLLHLQGGEVYTALEQMARQSTPGANGLMLNPSFIGGNGCYYGVDMEGLIWGLKLETTQNDLARMVVEAPLFDLADCYEMFYKAHGYTPKEIRVAGGGSRNALSRRIIAALFQLPVTAPDDCVLQNAGAIGAFMTACVALGHCSDFAEAGKPFQGGATEQPHPEDVPIYQQLLHKYHRFSAALAQLYKD